MTAHDVRWVALIEGFYGEPYALQDRLDLLRWLPSVGFTNYAYGPKDDPFHRSSWRDPYPPAVLTELQETARVADEVGITLTLSVSPGLTWQGEADHGPLLAKVRQLYDIGVRSLGIYWDDVPPGGADLGRSHGLGVTAAKQGLPSDVRWMTCGTDYAMDYATPYLMGFAAALPAGIPIAWTGPDVTSPVVTAEVARSLSSALQHPLLLCDNWPVNDLGMSSVLHLGPAPNREPDLRNAVVGIGFNAMQFPLASRIGLELGARHWLHPNEDRDTAWRDVIGRHAGLAPLAIACRSWIDAPGPDPELLAWLESALLGDDRLSDYLMAGCRAGLDPALAAELEPWLATWQAEADVMTALLNALRGRPLPAGFNLGLDWPALHRRDHQLFGTRLAVYGLSVRVDHQLFPHPSSIVRGENLTDVLVRRTLETLLR